MVEKSGSKIEAIDLLGQLVNTYEHAGRPQQALETLRRVVALNEELTRKQREQAVLGLQEKFSTERKTREIERLQLENARKQAELTTQTTRQQLWAATAVALMLAGLMAAQWANRVRQRNRLLEVDNAKLW